MTFIGDDGPQEPYLKNKNYDYENLFQKCLCRYIYRNYLNIIILIYDVFPEIIIII